VVTHLPFATPTNRPKKVPMSEGNPLALVVDDEVQIRRILRAGLELDGFAVEEAENGGDALRWATLRSPDLVILDLGLPDLDGSEVLERLRGWSTVPVIALSVRSNEAEKVRLLNKGADDYIVKPFGMAELLARARAAMRRYARASTEEPVIKLGPLAVDLAAHIVTIDGARVFLTPKEYRMLQLLAQHVGNVVTHQFLLKEIWGVPHLNDTHYLRIFMRKLRQRPIRRNRASCSPNSASDSGSSHRSPRLRLGWSAVKEPHQMLSASSITTPIPITSTARAIES
jgi:two-component system KDP operon response regulator KdpE